MAILKQTLPQILCHLHKWNGNIFNSLVALNSEGKIINNYNKMHLVPFGEFIPFEHALKFLNLKKVTFGYQSFSRGKSREVLKINGNLVLPLVCYEVIDTTGSYLL